MADNSTGYPALLALGLIFLIVGYTYDQTTLMIMGLIFGTVGLRYTLPQIKNNFNPDQNKEERKRKQ